jgi:hypothetical protein
MAKAKENNVKSNFGKRKGGKAKKFASPKDKKVKKSRGQGRG